MICTKASANKMPLTTAFILTTLLICANTSANEFDALIKAKKFAEAERAINAKLAIEPNNVNALVAKTDLILTEGKESRLGEATKIAEQCITAHSSNSQCHEALGNVLGNKALKDGWSAISYAGKIRDSFQKAIELDAKNFSARSSLMQFYLGAPSIVGGGTSKAKDLIVDTIKVSPIAGALLQANFDIKEEKLDRAEAALLAITANSIEGSDDLTNIHKNLLSSLGHNYINAKRYGDCERIFREFSQRFPENIGAPYGMGRSLQEQGKHKEALPHFEKALSLEANAIIYYRLAKSLQALNDKGKAIIAFEKSLILKPELSKKIKTDTEDQLKLLK